PRSRCRRLTASDRVAPSAPESADATVAGSEPAPLRNASRDASASASPGTSSNSADRRWRAASSCRSCTRSDCSDTLTPFAGRALLARTGPSHDLALRTLLTPYQNDFAQLSRLLRNRNHAPRRIADRQNASLTDDDTGVLLLEQNEDLRREAATL